MMPEPPPPSLLVERIPPVWRGPTQRIAERLAGLGHRAWVVGGAVRDLLVHPGPGPAPLKDVDLVSAALPDEVEAAFERTVAVGKAFGIVVVVLDGLEIEVATFREERGYSDRRRPDEIRYTDSLELDARRRDFTLNALYLDPLDGTLADPTGGVADLARGLLCAVGEADARFREDGLRILRMARFLARFDLRPAPGLLEAARAELDSLAGVSPERVLDELSKIAALPRGAEAVRVLDGVGAAAVVVPRWSEERAPARLAELAALPSGAPLAAFLAALLGDGAAATRDALLALRASRDLVRSAGHVEETVGAILRRAAAPPPADAEGVGEDVALARDPAFEPALALAAVRGSDPEAVAAFAERARAASVAAPDPPFALGASDLIALGLRPGPALGQALARVTRAAFGGAFRDREGALAWARAHVVAPDASDASGHREDGT